MDLLQTLAGAITLGSALGATIAGFFAYRQKSLVTVLRESNNDYKERVNQLESEREDDRKTIQDLKNRVAVMEQEKILPLQQLTELIVKQHSEQIKNSEALTKEIAGVARSVTTLAKQLNREK